MISPKGAYIMRVGRPSVGFPSIRKLTDIECRVTGLESKTFVMREAGDGLSFWDVKTDGSLSRLRVDRETSFKLLRLWG
jgi:hypothetical protein